MTMAALALAGQLAGSGHAAVKTEAVEYRHGETVLQGTFAWDDAKKEKRPAVMVVHEWWGHGPYARRRAEELARLGYLAFACDMYGKGVYASTHEEAGEDPSKGLAYNADADRRSWEALKGFLQEIFR